MQRQKIETGFTVKKSKDKFNKVINLKIKEKTKR